MIGSQYKAGLGVIAAMVVAHLATKARWSAREKSAKVANGGLGFADSKAGAVYGLYTGMVYLMCLGGGWIADRITGQRRAVLMGGILIACGEFCLVVPAEASFYLGLVLLVCGTGLLKGNVSTIVGQLYT